MHRNDCNWFMVVIICTEIMKRFSISVDDRDYKRLRALARTAKPRLSIQYVVNYAIHELLRRADDPGLGTALGNPVPLGDRQKQGVHK